MTNCEYCGAPSNKRFCDLTCARKYAGSFPKTVRPAEKRFWEKVDKRGPDECWPWIAGLSRGYGLFKATTEGWSIPAHRYSWELHNGPIPDGMNVCHKCDNERCVNPNHLFLGSQKKNIHDMVKKGRYNGGRRPDLTDAQVRELRRLAAQGVPHKELAKKFNRSSISISRIVNRHYYADV